MLPKALAPAFLFRHSSEVFAGKPSTPGNDSSNLTATDSKPLPSATPQKRLLPFHKPLTFSASRISHMALLHQTDTLVTPNITPQSHLPTSPQSTNPSPNSASPPLPAPPILPQKSLSLRPQLARPLHKHIRNLHRATPGHLRLHTAGMFHAVQVKPYLPGFTPGAE